MKVDTAKKVVRSTKKASKKKLTKSPIVKKSVLKKAVSSKGNKSAPDTKATWNEKTGEPAHQPLAPVEPPTETTDPALLEAVKASTSTAAAAPARKKTTTLAAPVKLPALTESVKQALGPGNYRRIARDTGYAPQHITRVLKGAGVSFECASKIADAAGVSLDQLRAFFNFMKGAGVGKADAKSGRVKKASSR